MPLPNRNEPGPSWLGCWALVWAWCWVLALALGSACWAGLGCGINRYLSTLNPHPLVHCALAHDRGPMKLPAGIPAALMKSAQEHRLGQRSLLPSASSLTADVSLSRRALRPAARRARYPLARETLCPVVSPLPSRISADRRGPVLLRYVTV